MFQHFNSRPYYYSVLHKDKKDHTTVQQVINTGGQNTRLSIIRQIETHILNSFILGLQLCLIYSSDKVYVSHSACRAASPHPLSAVLEEICETKEPVTKTINRT